MKRKIIILGITGTFLLISGICYSCSYQKERSELTKGTVALETEYSELESTEKETTKKETSGKDNVEKESTEKQVREGFLPGEEQTSEDKSPSLTGIPEEKPETIIYVHVCGAVARPGVYAAEESARIVDVLKLAGGLTKEAAGDYLNQAQLVTDGQRIYVPTLLELEELNTSEYISGAATEEETKGTKDNKGNTKVNINTADAVQLMTLPGIGQSKANSIIEYRNANGTFKTIEDLMKIPGIKEGSFRQISDKITVD